MLNWYRMNRIGAVGVLACLFFGGIEVLVLLADGVKGADLHTPIGVLAELIASQFTKAPSLLRAGSERRELAFQLAVGFHLVLVPLCAALLWMRTRQRNAAALANSLLAMQVLLCAAGLSSLVYVVAAELAIVLPLRRGLRWLALQIGATVASMLLIALAFAPMMHDDVWTKIWMYAAIGLLMQLIVFAVATLAVRERAARLNLAETNARLLATQSMLSDTVRASERLRIARDLHDAVGHHLTALNLHLDLALRQSAEAAPPSLRTSRVLASSLLAEVRTVVSAERRERIDLRAAITTLCSGIPQPAISFAFDDELEIDSPTLAHVLFFCVQEAITNTVRHADAARLQIALRRSGANAVLDIEDDGHGAHNAIEGNGLRGMRERIAEQGGTLQAGAGAARGYRLAIALPLAGSAA
jgi:two-component system sensor histidine kinase DesK